MNREANPTPRAALADRLARAAFLLGVAARVWGAWATRAPTRGRRALMETSTGR